MALELGEREAPGIKMALEECGFKVTSREFTPQEAMAKGSKFTKMELEAGKKAIRIIAQKPRKN